MHSSGMRTVRNNSRLLGGCTWSQGCTWSLGVYLVPGGVPGSRGVPSPGRCTWSGGVPGPRGCTWFWGCVYLVQGCTWFLGGCTWSWQVYLVLGVYLVPGVYLVLGGNLVPGVYLVLGVYLVPGGVPGPGGHLVLGGYLPRFSPACGQTDRCKNITFATSLQTVINTVTCENVSKNTK